MRCESDSCCTKESSDQYSWHIAGSLILISVFLFAKDVGWEALATKPYTDTDVLLASNWRTQKQWERWPIALFISLAQTLKCNRFWRYTSVISAEVNTSWTELQGKGSPPTHTLDKFWARKGIFCTVFPCQICTGLHKIYSYALLTKSEVKMAGYWPCSFFFCVFMDWDDIVNSVDKPNYLFILPHRRNNTVSLELTPFIQNIDVLTKVHIGGKTTIKMII